MRSAAAVLPRSALEDVVLSDDELAVARSVVYASLFDYPLTLAQLRATLIESTQTASRVLRTYNGSAALQRAIEYRDGFFFPRGRADLLEERRRREARSRQFLARHRLFLQLVCAIPCVRLAALSGSIAHLNLDEAGDLDLFLITRRNRVWSVTVAVVLLAKLMRRRRSVCANFVVADSRLALEHEDLFSASQIIHLKPLTGADVYRRFLDANPFVFRFYPNFHATDAMTLPFRPLRGLALCGRAAELLLAPVAPIVEGLCRFAYRRHLTRQAERWTSPEQVRLDDDYLKLHTRSHRQSVIERFNRDVQSFGCRAES